MSEVSNLYQRDNRNDWICFSRTDIHQGSKHHMELKLEFVKNMVKAKIHPAYVRYLSRATPLAKVEI